MRICILGSSSSGNATYIESEKARFLIDAGFPLRTLSNRLESISADVSELNGVFITHEHSDHVKGLKQLIKKYHTPVYATRHTAQALERQLGIEPDFFLFSPGEPFAFFDLFIEGFSVFHDAQDPVGFCIWNDSAKISMVSDLGFVTSQVKQKVTGSNIMIIECNHDEKMLDSNPHRPWHLKQRIKGRQGHLSNEAAAQLIAETAHDALDHVVLFHLSQDCNRPARAEEIMHKTLNNLKCYHTMVHQTFHDRISPVIEYPKPVPLTEYQARERSYDQLEIPILTT